jgi:hypothetical protein
MNEKTLTALKASIKHWEELCEIDDPNKARLGHRECALCEMFIKSGCFGCPVFLKTGNTSCYDTPYPRASNTLFDWYCGVRWYVRGEGHIKYVETSAAEYFDAAQAMLAFLKSLLPSDANEEPSLESSNA